MFTRCATSRLRRLTAIGAVALGLGGTLFLTSPAKAQSFHCIATSGAYLGAAGGVNEQTLMYMACNTWSGNNATMYCYMTNNPSLNYNFYSPYASGSISGQTVGQAHGAIVSYNGYFYAFAEVGNWIHYWIVDPTKPAGQTVQDTPAINPGTPGESVAAAVIGRNIYVFTTIGYMPGEMQSDRSIGAFVGSSLVQNTAPTPGSMNFAAVYPLGQMGASSPGSSAWAKVLTAITIGSEASGSNQQALVIVNDYANNVYSVVFDPAAGGFQTNTLAQIPASNYGGNSAPILQASGIQGTLNGTLLPVLPGNWEISSAAGTVGLFASCQNSTVCYQTEFEYSLANNTWTWNGKTNWMPAPAPPGYSYWPVACAPYYTAQPSGNLQQYVAVTAANSVSNDIIGMLESDVWVPLATQSQLDANPWNTSAATDESAASQVIRMTWKIIGVVLGVPPYMPNGKDPTEDVLASLQIGESSGSSVATQVTESQTFGVGSDTTIGGKHCNNETDISATMGQSSTQGHETDITESLGYTYDNTDSAGGTMGWLFIKAPIITTQDYQSVQYGYSGDTNTSSPNGYDMYLFTSTGMELQTQYFDLQTPAGPNSQQPVSLLSGIKSLPYSTDVEDWMNPSGYNWGGPPNDPNTGQPMWSVVAGGTGTNIVNTLNIGNAQTESYSQTQTQSTSNDVSSEMDVSDQVTVKIPFFKEQASVSFTDSMDQSGSVSTSIDKTVQTTLDVPPGGATPGYLNSMAVQPWLLQATSYNAPWVPEDYFGPLPWCFTWSTLGININPASSAKPIAAAAGVSAHSGKYSISPTPDSTRISVRGLPSQYANTQTPAGKALAVKASVTGAPTDSFRVRNGKLATLEADGSVKPIAMTAAQFDPVKGITLKLRGAEFMATGAEGRWRRSGANWQFTSTNRQITANLDFRTMKWNASVDKADMGRQFADMDTKAELRLGINGLITLVSIVEPAKVSYGWGSTGTSLSNEMFVSTIEVSRDYRNNGDVKLAGIIGKKPNRIGDLTVGINGSNKVEKLMTGITDFMKKVMLSQPLSYRDGDSTFNADLAKKTWTTKIKTKHFADARTRHTGKATIRLEIGGKMSWEEKMLPDYYWMLLE
ncbi:MAG: hypothetical protein NTY46_12790 [Candidatus Sumerlaeota bacterium]|nr:hypothetical protein [Candidatus Sumerlaeota bacterium]